MCKAKPRKEGALIGFNRVPVKGSIRATVRDLYKGTMIQGPEYLE